LALCCSLCSSPLLYWSKTCISVFTGTRVHFRERIKITLYREKAKKDAAAVGNHVAKLLQSIGQAPESISEKELKLLFFSFKEAVSARTELRLPWNSYKN